MNSLFFWIIVLSFLIPMAMRYYKKSVRGRNQNQGMTGGPEQSGQFPGDTPGGGAGNYPGQQSKQPRDGFTQRDYYGGFGQLGAPQQPMPPANQPYPGQPYPGGQSYPAPVPYEDSPEYPGNRPFQQQDPQQFNGGQSTPPQPNNPQPAGPAVPAPPSAPQGFRARKLAELDQRYSEGELSMEDYMAQRADIMKG
ncbi:hypothetical protein [Pseudarthrobacter sp. ATCC 49987]|uniref:hypothetical protein n=1 Tax=Pseudarthrobacter sp. ATCC 49987 TaxID=2698204 RepID=UPI00136FA24A|nr:hypothetical protein [Pseudarthrobacter sp. ATCC 49987]